MSLVLTTRTAASESELAMSWNDLHGQESIIWRAPRTDHLLYIIVCVIGHVSPKIISFPWNLSYCLVQLEESKFININ